MKDLLYIMVDWIAMVHDSLLKINDHIDMGLSDKWLHFIVIGLLGLCIYFATHFVFKRLAKKSVSAISWIYTMTVIVVITFAIEIGQHVTGTGAMEAMDIIRGLEGVLFFGVVYTLAARLIHFIKGKLGNRNKY